MGPLFSGRFIPGGFSEYDRTRDYHHALDSSRIQEALEEPNALVLDAAQLQECLRAFIDELPSEWLYEQTLGL